MSSNKEAGPLRDSRDLPALRLIVAGDAAHCTPPTPPSVVCLALSERPKRQKRTHGTRYSQYTKVNGASTIASFYRR